LTDNTTWIVLGGLVVGLGLLMLLSTPSQPVADAVSAPPLAELETEALTRNGQGAVEMTVAGRVPGRGAPVPSMAARADAMTPCDGEPVRTTCPAFESYRRALEGSERSYAERCEPIQPPCEDPCTPHVRPLDPYIAEACVCDPCWLTGETDGLCDRPSCEPTRIPYPFWPEAERPCRPSTPPTPLIERSYQEWVTEGDRIQLHGSISNPAYIDVCFQWSADRGMFENPESLDPVFVAPLAERWGDSVCITLTTFDSCGGRRFDQIRLRLNPDASRYEP
jgi:hypothetical protein